MPNVRSLRRCPARPRPPRPCATLSDGYARFGRPSVLRPAPDAADKDVRGEAEADRRRARGEALRRAGIEHADGFVAVTEGDNRNIMASQIAKHVFKVPHVVARIYDPERAEAYEKLGLHTICPTIEGALHIQKVLLERESK